MADITIPNLTEETNPSTTDDLIVETVAGTRRADLANLFPRRSQVPVITFDNLDVANDRVYFGDATDDRIKGVSLFDLLYAPLGVVVETDDFTLQPLTHNIRPVECTTTFTTNTITLDTATANQGGCTYFINNFTTTSLVIAPAGGMILFVNGTAAANGIIRQDTSASVVVRSNNAEAIFSGG